MARYTRRKRHRRRRSGSLRKAAESRREPKLQTPVKEKGLRRNRKKQSVLGMFLRKHIKVVAVAALVVIVGGIALGIVFGGRETTTSAQPGVTGTNTPEETIVEIGDEFDEEIEYSYDDVEESVLAGMAGSDDSLFSEMDEEMADAIFAEEGIRIGVTIGDLDSDTDKLLLSRLEQASNVAEVGKLVYDVYYYNAEGDFNQQLQDVRSLIKNKVDAIIVGATTKESFDMIVVLADEAAIPVVAYNAPEGVSGYAINIVANQASWGEVYGEFMAENLAQGRIVQVLGSEDSELDIERAAAINTALAANVNISTRETFYEKWDNDDAHVAMAEYLDDKGYVEGVITEEGMGMGILEAYLDTGKLPKVVCGDVSAEFITTWYELKTKGVDITPKPEDDEEVPTVILKAQPGEMIVIAQPAPVSIGAVAFEIAYKLSQGRTLKNIGTTYVYSVETIITDSNLPIYYAMVKDEPNDFLVRDVVSQETIESLLNPMEETQEDTEE